MRGNIPGLPFKELAQLKQVGTSEAYILEFENISVMVSDVSMARLVLLFTEGLIEHLIGIVKAQNPTTLKDVVGCFIMSKLIHLFFNYQPGFVSLELTQNICEGRGCHVNSLTNKRSKDISK